MGSTDNQGNRLSNLPGERPSFASVAPYDEKPENLISKVELATEQKKPMSLLEKLQEENRRLKESDKVKKNGGKGFERDNFVKIN